MTQRAKDFLGELQTAPQTYVHVDIAILREALAEAFRKGYGNGWQDALAGSVMFRDDQLAATFLGQEKAPLE